MVSYRDNNVILTVVTASKPWVSCRPRGRYPNITERFIKAKQSPYLRYMQQLNIPRALGICRKLGWKFDIMTTSFFLSRRSLKASAHSGLPLWQDKLFILLARRHRTRPNILKIPTGRVVEIETQVIRNSSELIVLAGYFSGSRGGAFLHLLSMKLIPL